VIRAANVRELFAAAGQVPPGGTILVADGHYLLTACLDLHTDNVTLRSESGQRDRVVLDGSGPLGELVSVTRCSGATIADLTIQNAKWNGFKVNSDKGQGVRRLTICNCVIHNIWQRGVKGPRVPPENREALRPADCRVQYCLFYNDRPKRPSDDEADEQNHFGGNYVGGMDIMCAGRWTICDNVFVGIQGRTREGRGAIFLWVDTRDCLVQRNVIIDCDCGICLGNSFRGPGEAVHCTRCTVRNNFVAACPENGILADYTRDCKIVHNTIHDPASRMQRLIRVVHDNPGLVVANNLLSGKAMQIETQSPIRLEGNVIRDLTAALVGPGEGNLRLRAEAAAALPTVSRLDDAPQDIDGHPRPPKTLPGAHQPPSSSGE
jgi:hypothetical protein